MHEGRCRDVLVVGAGHAGTQLAIVLRREGYAGSVALVGAENRLPYERPPLTKDYLLGFKGADQLLIRPAEFWADQGVELLLGQTVREVDPLGHTVTTSDGVLRYGTLVWAAGGAPRRWTGPGADLHGVHCVRGLPDIDAITAGLPGADRVCVVGGGYVGLETAAALRKLGAEVTLVEAADRVLARVAGEEVSRFVETAHRMHGVEVRTGTGVAAIVGSGGSVTAVEMVDGSRIDCGIVVIGIGIEPVVAPLREAGALTDNGLVVDHLCRTNLPDVLAIGDCVMRANRFADGRPTRLESVHNAGDHAAIAARHVCGGPPIDETLPWFWSNQYGIRLQTVGLSAGHDCALTRGDVASGRFSVVYLRENVVIALDCVNVTRDYVQGRSLVMQDVAGHIHRITDPAVPLKSIAQDLQARKPRRGSEHRLASGSRPYPAIAAPAGS